MKKIQIILLIFITFPLFAQSTIKPGDGIKLRFYNIEDSVKGNYYVEENGTIQFPYIGTIKTNDRDFTEIKNEIIKKYSNIYVNPEINVQPLLRISIIGEVKSPGVYYLTGFETISDLIAIAGGESNDSNIDNITLLRNDTQMHLDLEAFLNGEQNLHDVGLESGDKVFVPRTWWVGARDASIIVSGVAVLVTVASLFTAK